jgi:hypothetical protein
MGLMGGIKMTALRPRVPPRVLPRAKWVLRSCTLLPHALHACARETVKRVRAAVSSLSQVLPGMAPVWGKPAPAADPFASKQNGTLLAALGHCCTLRRVAVMQAPCLFLEQQPSTTDH